MTISSKLHTLIWLIPALMVLIAGCAQEEKVDFNADIRPILNNKCINCHGGVKQSGGFGLVFRENALAKTASDVYGIVPGHPEKSELIKRITHHDPEFRMPLDGEPLSDEEIELITHWIELGADWETHWAYQKPTEPEIPQLDMVWGNNPIDNFALQKMLENGLEPSSQANKYDLIRRVSLDLTGLPPSLEQVEKFVQDESPDAFEKVVDELLASPRFGEHWATMWLDLARYADSRGYESDGKRFIWKYRDWVINTLNQDKPFDQFTIEQLAGDMLPSPSVDQLIATGFHRNTMNNDEGGTFNEEYRIYAVIDRVNTTWETWQATTMSCVQCHGHPYDPIDAKDFYQSMAFFNNTADWDIKSEFPVLKELKEEDQQKLEEIKSWVENFDAAKKFKKLKKQILTGTPRISHDEYTRQVNTTHHNRALQDYVVVSDSSMVEVDSLDLTDKKWLVLYSRQRKPAEGKVILLADDKTIGEANLPETKNFLPLFIELSSVKKPVRLTLQFASSIKDFKAELDGFTLVENLPGEEAPEFQKVRNQVQQLFAAEPAHTTLIMQEKPTQFARKTHFFNRGSYLDQREEVTLGLPAVLGGDSLQLQNRLQFARWLVSEDNPLTARVTVNRFWARLFGKGIVVTEEDFGTMGDKPTHPGLLDWLALRFSRDYQWSMKKLLKTMVMSATYRQASRIPEKAKKIDSDNRWLSYSSRVRLSAEQVRDQALAVTGLLSDKMFGPGVMPHQPEGIWNIPYSDWEWETSKGEDAYRRAIYTLIRRSNPYPSFINFDASSRQVCQSRRINTNTPLQALNTLNDPVYFEAARHLAKQMLQLEGNVEEKLAQAYQITMRQPAGKEKLNLLKELYSKMKSHYKQNPQEAETLAGKQGGELAAMAVVANTLLNMDEFLVKS